MHLDKTLHMIGKHLLILCIKPFTLDNLITLNCGFNDVYMSRFVYVSSALHNWCFFACFQQDLTEKNGLPKTYTVQIKELVG